MLSERSYWIILIVGFAGFALSIWFILIPYGVVEYNLGVNLFTSSIFMVFTIVLLGWLLNLREKREWKPIVSRMIERIRDCLNSLFTLLQNLCEISENKHETALMELAKADKILLRNDISEYLSRDGYDLEGYIGSMEEYSEILHDIRMEYLRFMDSKLMDSLIVIEDRCRDLAFNFKTLTRIEFGPYKDSEKAFFEDVISPLVQEVIKEIQKIHESGIEIRGHGGIRFHVRPTPSWLQGQKM
jgi:hypothetical protein